MHLKIEENEKIIDIIEIIFEFNRQQQGLVLKM